MLGFSSEGMASGQDLGAWTNSFAAAFARPEAATPVNLGSSDDFSSSERIIETVAELLQVSVVAAACRLCLWDIDRDDAV